MKSYLIPLAVLAIPLFAGSSNAAPSAASCQPLTDANKAECCSAANWREIISPEFQGLCGKKSQNTAQPADDTVGSTTPAPGTPGTTNDGTTGGNPGNANNVGNAGEKGMNGESPSTGTKGTSN